LPQLWLGLCYGIISADLLIIDEQLYAAYSYPKKRRVVKKLKQNQKGFTLIELLVVIAIIGLLASVVLLALNSARQKSRDAKRLADVRQLATALELYYDAAVGGASGYPGTAGYEAGIKPAYIGALPTYPTPTDGTCGTGTYAYTSTASASYQIVFCLGASTGGLTAGTHTLTQAGIE
jgi:prepilin-type N-terminal cleavage/methylation domain-containing protein